MPRFTVPTTILASIEVHAPDAVAAMFEARRFAESLGDDTGGFRDGWNDVQRRNSAPIITDISGFDVEGIDADAVEQMPARWVVQPQRDWHADDADAIGTRIEPCGEDEATSWGVFEVFYDEMHPLVFERTESDLVEDYPTRDAAEAAVTALEAGNPLPTPEWPEVQ